MNISRLCPLWIILICFAFLGGHGLAQSPSAPEASESQVAGWSGQLDAIAERIKDTTQSDDVLSQLRDEVEAIRSDTQKWIAEQQPQVETARTDLEALGPAPGEGEAPEAAGVAAQRQELVARLASVLGPIKEGELIIDRSSRLISAVGQIRRERFAERILTRGPSPLSPSVWRRALPEMASIASSFAGSLNHVLTSPQFQEKLRDSILAFVAALVLSIILVWPVRRWLLQRYGFDASISQPTFMQALRAMLVVGAARALLPTTAAALIFAAVVSGEILTSAGREIGWAVFLGVILFIWTIALFRASLSPQRPDWRIVPVPTNFVVGIRAIVIGLALTLAVDIVLSGVISTYSARLSVTILRDFALTIVVTILLLILMLRQKMWIPEGQGLMRPRWRLLRFLVAGGLLALLILGATGYVILARFVTTQLILTGGLIVLILMLHQLGREFIRQGISNETWTGERLRTSLRMDQDGVERFEFWTGLAYDAALIVFGLVAGLLMWGADKKEVGEWAYQAAFGFKIGRMTFSLVDLVIAVVLFSALVLATQFIQRLLAEKILPQTQLDVGVRQSIRTAVGYFGIIIAAVIGISTIGVDLSNFAIVAGALSVGIGFGLQNVVNNFVSGLILLVERPVKIGDWIVVGDKQGYVKKIKVRATEIQTFDRAAVFVPNSQLISEAVTNWTYADKMGRIIIPLGVAYGSNTRLVRETLLEIGRSHPSTLKEPGPSALFRGFGDSALNFELRCFVGDVETAVGVSSDLCFAIDDAFRAKGIEIPFPQQDIHLRQPVSKALVEKLTEPAGQN